MQSSATPPAFFKSAPTACALVDRALAGRIHLHRGTRRFRVISNVDELAWALEYPWEKRATFLHPEQRKIVERDFAGPARVAGSGGTDRSGL